MAIKMKKYARRLRRRMRARKLRVPRQLSNRSAKVNVKRITYTGVWNLNNVAVDDYWKYFEPTLGNGFNNIAEYQNIFDLCKVNAIKVSFMPRFDNLAGPVTGATPMTVRKPYFAISVDPESNQTPIGTYTQATLNTMIENGAKIRDASKPVHVYWRPKIAVATTTASTAVWWKKAPYLRLTETNVAHRGFHIMGYQQGFGTTFTDISWDVIVTMYVTFKNIR